MTPHALQMRVARLTRQRNLLIGGLALLAATNFAVASLAALRTTETILIPTQLAETAIRDGQVSDDYLLGVTRDVATLMLNRHPHDTDYFRDSVLRIVEPRHHGALEASMAADERLNRYKSGERTFHATDLCRVRTTEGGLVTEIVGKLNTYLNDRKVASEELAQRFVWRLDGRRVWLRDTLRLEVRDSACVKIKAEDAS
ncbi:MAG: TraE/TraK family type IV conjugative transfer system protein [Litorimonas sp.]